MTELDQVLAALADPTRREIVRMLTAGPRSAGTLNESFDISAPALSRHLKILRRSGLVMDERTEADNRVRLYALQPQSLQPIQQWLRELEAGWQDQLAAFKKHAEK